MNPNEVRMYEKSIAFHERLMALADELGIFLVSERIVVLDRASGAATTMAIYGKRGSGT